VAENLYGYLVRHARSGSLARLLLDGASGIGLVGILVVGGREVAVGRLDWQGLLSILIAMIALYAPFVSLLAVYNNIRAVLPNLARAESVFREAPEITDAPDALSLLGTPDRIEVRNVWFGYDGEPILKDVSATFHRGETVGIVGPSGAGKSTLISLLLRFYDPTDGSILLDGVDIRQIKHGDLMAQCAIVPQEPLLFLDTIANNIRLARPGASMAEVVQAARFARIHEEILAMPNGYETRVGRDTEARDVSVGQKQRIVIAAAFLKNGGVLFMDEATSNLDAVSARAVEDAIWRLRGDRITFIVAHRLSAISEADRILVLDRGRVVGFGPHGALLRDCPVYRVMWVEQHRGAEKEQQAAFPANQR
jgi:subfamily B ATP-binding cassette protein MsbA